MQQHRGDVVAYSLALLAVAIFAALIVQDSRFRAPLTWDEWLTVESYTWVGITETGDQRPIRRASDFEHLANPSVRNLALGLYCALGRWPEPNNHVVHSALLNAALAVRRTSAMARTPALAGALLFGLLMFHLCWSALGWRAGAFAVLVLALGWPYTIDFAATARGYTWGLALQALWLALMLAAARRPTSIAAGSAMAAAAMASLANIVTSAVLWIAPAYAAVLMVKPDVVDSDRRDWRRNLTIQMLAVGAVGFIFLVDRLPAVFSSTQQYGTGVSSLRESLAGLINFLRFLFPVPIWSAVAAIGAVGLAAMSWQSGLRWLAAIGLAVVAVDGAYLLQVARLPYPRVMFHLIPVVLLGVGYAITRLSDRAGAGSVWPGAVATLVALMVVRLAQPVHAAYDDQMRSLVQRTLSSYAPNDPPTYPVIGPGVDAPALGHQLPEKWLDTDMRIPDGVPLQLAVFVRQTDDWKMEVLSRPGAPHRWYPATWAPADAKASSDIGYRLMLVRGDTYAWPVRSSTVPRRVVFWYPDADRLNASPSTATAIIAASNLRYFEIQKRRTIKVNLYGTLFAVAVITESPQEVASADEAIGAAIAKFGGTAVAFIDGDQPRP